MHACIATLRHRPSSSPPPLCCDAGPLWHLRFVRAAVSIILPSPRVLPLTYHPRKREKERERGESHASFSRPPLRLSLPPFRACRLPQRLYTERRTASERRLIAPTATAPRCLRTTRAREQWQGRAAWPLPSASLSSLWRCRPQARRIQRCVRQGARGGRGRADSGKERAESRESVRRRATLLC